MAVTVYILASETSNDQHLSAIYKASRTTRDKSVAHVATSKEIHLTAESENEVPALPR